MTTPNRTRYKQKIGIFIALTQSCMILSNASYAQTDEGKKPQSMRLEEVLVTAQKRSENVRDVPISLAVMSLSLIHI